MEYIIPIAAHAVLAVLLVALFLLQRTTPASDDELLRDPDAALQLYRRHCGEARGSATLSADRRAALLSLQPGSGTGLLVRRGRRWSARPLGPGDVRRVALSCDHGLDIRLAGIGWAPIHIELTDTPSVNAWRARLQALTETQPQPRGAG